MLPLEIKDVALTVNETHILRNINLQLTDNGITIVMGHNGAGKSILLRCMHGLLEPTEGKIQWNGDTASDVETRKKQAMVFQKPLMLNRSAAANIEYVLKLRDKPKSLVMKYLQSANLDSKSNQPAKSLSGGEQQRLAIARAIACDPEAIFFDEPTANLDPDATLQIESQIISASQQSIKVIMVTHDIAQARRLADDVVFLNKGTITEHCSADKFFTRPESAEAGNYLSAYIK